MHRVIVTLKLDPAVDEKAAITAAQNKVLEALSGLGVSINRRYESLPMLALDVDDQALTRLKSLPQVASVQANGLNFPTKSIPREAPPDNRPN